MAITQSKSSSGAPADIAALRTQAVEAIRIDRSAERLSEVLKKVDDPRLLDKPNEKHDYWESLLEWSIREVAPECARLLIETGADPMKSQGRGFSSVHQLACSSKDMTQRQMLGFVELLSSAGADFNAMDDDGCTPLHFAVAWGSPAFAEILIGRGAPVDESLLDDLAQKVPPEGDEDRPSALKALAVVERAVRAQQLEESILSAMPAEGEPRVKPSTGMTL